MPFSRRRVLGSRGGAAVLPLQAVGIVAGGRVGAEFGVFGVAECDYELIVFFEGASQGADFAALDCVGGFLCQFRWVCFL